MVPRRGERRGRFESSVGTGRISANSGVEDGGARRGTASLAPASTTIISPISSPVAPSIFGMMSATLSSRSSAEALGSDAGGRSERAVVMLVSMRGADGDGDRRGDDRVDGVWGRRWGPEGCRSGRQRPIYRCTTDPHLLGDRGGSHATGLEFLDLRRIDAGRATTIFPGGLRFAHALHLALMPDI